MLAIQTNRLRLQALECAHEALYCRIYADPALMRHVAEPLSEEHARRSFQVASRQSASLHPAWWWAIHRMTTGEPLGVAGLTGREDGSVEIGVMLLAEAQGRGIATETFSALLEVAFSTLKLSPVRARHARANVAMAAILRRLGFHPEDTVDDSLPAWQVWRLDAPPLDSPVGINFAKPFAGV